MTKVLHISKFYPPYAGGIEDVCRSFVQIIAANSNIEQKVFCFTNSKENKYETYEGIDVIRIGVCVEIASQPISTTYKKELTKIMNDFKPDIVHFHAPNPFASYLLLSILPEKTKLIVHWHSDIVAQKYLYHLVKRTEKKLLRRSDTIIATSPNYIEGSKPLQKFREKIIVIPNIIDSQKLEITPFVKEQAENIKAQYNCPIILFVGRHVPYKGLEYLIKAEPKITENCVILIGGSGKQTDYFKSICNSKKVIFLGRIPDELLPAYYHASDIFAFPSVTKNEAFGVALAEAMYTKTPAVTFTIEGSGVNWVNLSEKTGIEVENKNITKLADAINILVKNHTLREKYAENARQRVEENFTIDRVKDMILDLYK